MRLFKNGHRDVILSYISVLIGYVIVSLFLTISVSGLSALLPEVWFLLFWLVLVTLAHGLLSLMSKGIGLFRSTGAMILLAGPIHYLFLAIQGWGSESAFNEVVITFIYLHVPALLMACGLRFLVPWLRPHFQNQPISIQMSGVDLE